MSFIATYEDSAKCLGVMFCGKLTCLLQIISDGEELLKTDPRDVNDMSRRGNGYV